MLDYYTRPKWKSVCLIYETCLLKSYNLGELTISTCNLAYNCIRKMGIQVALMTTRNQGSLMRILSAHHRLTLHNYIYSVR